MEPSIFQNGLTQSNGIRKPQYAISIYTFRAKINFWKKIDLDLDLEKICQGQMLNFNVYHQISGTNEDRDSKQKAKYSGGIGLYNISRGWHWKTSNIYFLAIL